MIGRFTSCTLAMQFFAKNAHVNQGWGNIHCKADTCVPIVAPGVPVGTSPRSDADAASGDRPPEQDVPDWFQTFTERLVEGASVSSSSAGDTILTQTKTGFNNTAQNADGRWRLDHKRQVKPKNIQIHTGIH